MPNFNEGDVVRLISGGPEMTITSVGRDTILCVWFEKAIIGVHCLHTETFQPNTLLKIVTIPEGKGK